MNKLIAAVVLCLPLAAVAAESADAPPPESARHEQKPKKKLGSFKEFGQELGKVGSSIGKGTVDSTKGIGNKVSSDVKKKNFKPRSQPAPEPNKPDRGGTD